MTTTVKKIIAGGVACIVAFAAYYGTYLPFQKSNVFIQTVRAMGGVRSLEEFKKGFIRALSIPSPIGHEELVRNMTTEIVSFVGRGATNLDIEEELDRFVEELFKPIVMQGKGMSFGQDLYILGTFRRILYQHTKKPEHLDAAEQYYLKGLALGPRRPQSLYGLLDVYLLRNDAARAYAIAEQLRAQWPSDERVGAVLQAINNAASSSAPTSTRAGKK